MGKCICVVWGKWLTFNVVLWHIWINLKNLVHLWMEPFAVLNHAEIQRRQENWFNGFLKASISLPQISSQIPKPNSTNILLNDCIHFLQTKEATLRVLIDLRFMVWVISVHLMPINTSLIFILYFPLHWAKQALQYFLSIWKIYMRVSCDQCI